jgi:hypothetical protein
VDAIARLEQAANRGATVVAVGVWAACEAFFFPIVPDVGVCLLALAAPWRAARFFGAVVVGALIGTAVLAVVATRTPDAVHSMLLALPGIDAGMLADTDRSIARDGILGFVQFGPGAPLKVDTAAWIAHGGDTLGLLAGTILNRLTRVGPPVLAAAVIGSLAGPWIRAHHRATLVAYAAFWIGVYACIWVVA